MVKLGVIGAGKWGINHVRVYSELAKEKKCELIGIADVKPETEKTAIEYNIKFFTDYKKLLPLVDAVSVVVPTHLHYEVVKECLNSGKHVLVEKPITSNSEQARELIELAKLKKKILTVGYLFRYNAAVLELKEQLKKVGNIQYITARYMHSSKPPRKDSGVILNFGVHLIDILNFILGKKPQKVYCIKKNFLSREREDVAFITLDYGKFAAQLEVSWFHPLKARDMWLIAEKEKIYADFFEQIIKKYPLEISYEKVSAEAEVEVPINKNEPLKAELEHFCFGIVKGKIEDAEEEYLITKLCELCMKSAETEEVLDVRGLI